MHPSTPTGASSQDLTRVNYGPMVSLAPRTLHLAPCTLHLAPRTPHLACLTARNPLAIGLALSSLARGRTCTSSACLTACNPLAIGLALSSFGSRAHLYLFCLPHGSQPPLPSDLLSRPSARVACLTARKPSRHRTCSLVLWLEGAPAPLLLASRLATPPCHRTCSLVLWLGSLASRLAPLPPPDLLSRPLARGRTCTSSACLTARNPLVSGPETAPLPPLPHSYTPSRRRLLEGSRVGQQGQRDYSMRQRDRQGRRAHSMRQRASSERQRSRHYRHTTNTRTTPRGSYASSSSSLDPTGATTAWQPSFAALARVSTRSTQRSGASSTTSREPIPLTRSSVGSRREHMMPSSRRRLAPHIPSPTTRSCGRRSNRLASSQCRSSGAHTSTSTICLQPLRQPRRVPLTMSARSGLSKTRQTAASGIRPPSGPGSRAVGASGAFRLWRTLPRRPGPPSSLSHSALVEHPRKSTRRSSRLGLWSPLSSRSGGSYALTNAVTRLRLLAMTAPASPFRQPLQHIRHV